MPDLDDLLRADGARWRDEVDRRTAESGLPALAPPAESRPTVIDRFRAHRSPRTSLLLSAAAITVAALVIGGGIVLAAESGGDHQRALPALTATPTGPATSSAPTSPSASPSARKHHTSPAARRSTSGRGGVVVPSHRSTHPASDPRSSPGTAIGSSGPTSCGADALDVAVSAPASAGDHDTLTITATNTSATACAVSGYPTVSFPDDPSIAVGQAADSPGVVVLSPGQAASSELDWDGTTSGTCTSESTVSVTPPSGGGATLALDPPAQVCAATSVVVHALTAG